MGKYKMKHQGVPALMKALVGDQHKLPEHLKEAIKNAPSKKEPGNKNKKDTFRYESDMGDYSPTITAKKKTRGGPGNQPPVADSEGRVRKAGESFGSRGSRVVSTTGAGKDGKRKPGTRQETVEVSYSSGKKSPARKEDQTSEYGKKHDRLKNQAKKLDDRSLDPNNPVSDKKFNRLQDRRDRKINKARKIRKRANS